MFLTSKTAVEGKAKSLPKHLKHFSYEKVWYESKKMIAFLLSMGLFLEFTSSDTDWKVITAKGCFILLLYTIFAVAKTFKDVVVVMKQVEALIDSNK